MKYKVFFTVKLRHLFIFFAFLGSISLFQSKALADYDFDVITDVWSTETEDATFEFSADEDELSCSAGGGSTPSMWVGTMTGQGNTSVNDYDGTDKTDDFLTGGLGFNIPLGGKSNYNNCDRILAIVETERFLKMMKELKSLEVYDENQIKAAISSYLSSVQKKLGADFVSTLKLN